MGQPAASDPVSKRPGPADLERALLGGEAELSLDALAEATGVPVELAGLLWRALGFPDAAPPGRVFTTGDRAALARLTALVADAGADPEFGVSLIRALGHHMSRLVTWQVIALVEHMSKQAGDGDEGAARAVAFMAEHLDDLDAIVTYAWRRHLAAVTKWRLGRVDEDALRFALTVGFADMAGYTRLSQRMDAVELADLVGRFETVSADVILRQGGRVIKTVGDEVLFVGDTPVQAVDIALDLAAAMGTDDVLPDVRVGLATGEVVGRMGDVFGPTVNLASRLTSLAAPGSVLADPATAAALFGHPMLQVIELDAAELPDFGTVAACRITRY